MMDEKWGASDVAEGIDYPRTPARFRTRNMAFRLTIFTVVVLAITYGESSAQVIIIVSNLRSHASVPSNIIIKMYERHF